MRATQRDLTEESLLHMVLECPEDDAPRLVYADWLDENGAPERAEFIRVQCELAQLEAPYAHPLYHLFTSGGIENLYLYEGCAAAVQRCQPDPVSQRVQTLLKRRAALLEKHRSSWIEALPGQPPDSSSFFRRGFVEGLSARTDSFLEHGLPYFESTPILHLHLWESLAGFDQLAHVPRIRRLRSLILSRLRAGELQSPGSVDAVCRSPWLPELRGLTLGEFGDDAGFFADALCDVPFQRLQGLGLPYARMDRVSFAGLIESPALSSLNALDVSHAEREPDSLAALRGAAFVPKLTHLFVNSVPMDEAHARSLFSGQSPGSLICLNLSHCALDAAAIQLLCDDPWLQTVRILHLNENNLGDAGAEALAQSSHLRNLLYLNLNGNGISSAGIAALARSPNLASLRYLVLKQANMSLFLVPGMHNEITNDAGRTLAGSPQLQELRVLFVGVDFDEDVKRLLKARFGYGAM